jgi:hypothetical protein
VQPVYCGWTNCVEKRAHANGINFTTNENMSTTRTSPFLKEKMNIFERSSEYVSDKGATSEIQEYRTEKAILRKISGHLWACYSIARNKVNVVLVFNHPNY